MQFSDDGYIVGLRRHGENSLIVTLLSRKYGKIAGYIKGGDGRKFQGICQLGNLVSFNAYARLEENMPQFRGVELLKPLAVNFMSDVKKLAVLTSFCELMNLCLSEKENLEYMRAYIDSFMNNIDTDAWLEAYACMEYHLLSFLGIGLDLSECAVTGSKENLAFISPKTGHAVCMEVGLPYAEKLFKFPHWIVDKNQPYNVAEVAETLRLSEYFLNKNFFQVHGLKFPDNRANLLHILNLTKE